jgi:hypothetical protein
MVLLLIFFMAYFILTPLPGLIQIISLYPPFATPAGVSTWGASHLMPLPGQYRSIFLRMKG